MDLSYQIMRFGKKGRRITILHLRKPGKKGLAGMVMSNLFPHNIALVVDPRPIEELEYSFICLSRNTGIDSASVWMEEDVFYGIKRGDALARTSLFHELGHCYFRHLKSTKEKMDAYDEARSASVDMGQVIQEELDADQFAVDYLGTEYVITGLSELKSELSNRITQGFYDEETGTAAMKELDLRLMKLTEGRPAE